MGGGRQLLQRLLHRRRHAAQHLQLGLVAAQFRFGGQLAVHQQVGDLLEFAVGQIHDVVAAVMQVVAGAADRAKCGVARRRAGKRDGFLGLEAGCGGGRFAHVITRSSALECGSEATLPLLPAPSPKGLADRCCQRCRLQAVFQPALFLENNASSFLSKS
jgi:hypothetical protein